MAKKKFKSKKWDLALESGEKPDNKNVWKLRKKRKVQQKVRKEKSQVRGRKKKLGKRRDR